MVIMSDEMKLVINLDERLYEALSLVARYIGVSMESLTYNYIIEMLLCDADDGFSEFGDNMDLAIKIKNLIKPHQVQLNPT